MFRFLSLRLQTLLLLLVLLALVPALAVTYYTAEQQRDHATKEVQAQALGLARTAAGSYEDLVQDARQLLFTLVHLPEVRGGAPDVCNTLLGDIRGIHPSYTAIIVADAGGNVWCSTPKQNDHLNVADRVSVQRAVQRLDFAMGDYRPGNAVWAGGVGFAYPILDEYRQVRAVVALAVDLASIEELGSRTGLPPSAVLTVADSKGMILARYPDARDWVGKIAPDGATVRRALAQLKEGTVRFTGPDGTPHLYGLARSTAPDGESLYISVDIPADVVFAEGNRVFQRSLVALGIVGLLALIATWWFAKRFVLRPAKALVDATRRLSAGDLAARTGLPHTRNEVGELAGAFDQLAGSLQRRQAEAARASEALRHSERRFRGLTENASDIVAIIGSDERFQYISSSAQRLLGYTPEEIMGQSLRIYVHPEDVPMVIQAVAQAAQAPGAISRTAARVRRKDGSWRILEGIVKNAQGDPAVGGMIVNLRDITEQRNAQERIQQQLQALDNLYASARKLTESLDMRTLVDNVTRACVDTYGARLAWLGAAEPDGAVRLLGYYPGKEDYPRQISVRWDEQIEGEGPAGRAIRSGVPSVSLDIATHQGWAPWRALALSQGFTCAVALPLISQGKPFGVLVLLGDQPRAFTSERLETLQAYAHQAATALTNARLFDEGKRRLDQVQALRRVDLAITSSLDLRVTLGVALDQVATVLGVDAAAVLLLNSGTQMLEYAAGRGFRGREIERSLVRVGEGPSGHVALERRVVHFGNIPEMKNGFKRTKLIADEGFVSYVGVPLIVKGHVKGVLEVFHRAPFQPEDEWLEFLDALAGQVAIAIDEAALFNDLYRANVDLTLAYDTTLEGWARALELRDYETAGHSRRVSELTTRLARAMGVSETDMAHVRRGTMLHDVGKLSIPDTILLKSGPLTDEEWSVVRKHPTYAFELLSPIPYLRPALDIPYCHHERWDGTGYPRGLKGEQIPLSARIFTLVDVWDALTNERPYKKAWSVEDARAYMRSQSGAHFDPKVVEVFLALS
ncbi:MAG: GAF domain-containing protein [Dehalococcoidia bacterium]|nr:GAF domain-containing protein [Dehalococcoidia bacterium]